MPQPRRQPPPGDLIGELMLLLLLVMAILGYVHRIPARALAFGHALLLRLPASVVRFLQQHAPPGHRDLVDMLPLVAVLVAVGIAATVLDGVWGATRRRVRVRTLGELYTLTPLEFEEAICGLLAAQGYSDLQRVGRPGDLSAGIVGRDGAGRRVVAQCKQYGLAHRIEAPVVQTFVDVARAQHQADVAIFVTTSSYTQQALDLGRRHGLIMYDGNDLTRMLSRRRSRSHVVSRVA